MKKNEKYFLINVMWVPTFVGIMTVYPLEKSRH